MRIYLNRQGIYTRQTVLFSRYRCSRPARCCVFIRGKHPVCGEPLFCLSANPDSLSELCGFHIDHRSRSFLLQVSGVSSRLSFCCTSLVSGFIIHDKGRVVYSQSVQQMRRIFAPKIQKNWDTSTAPKCGTEHGRRDQRCLCHGAVLADVLLRPAEPCHLPPAVPPGRKAVNGHIKSVLQLYKSSITAAFGDCITAGLPI